MSYGKTLNMCTKFCTNDFRCIGIEMCEVRENLFWCQVCCEWMKTGRNYITQQPGCKYFEMEFEKRLNVAMTANASSEYGDLWKAANAVDGKTECPGTTDVAITNYQKNPWLKVNLYKTSTVERVLIYNRQDCCGGRLHDVSVSVIDNGRNVSCGFYPGPAANGDRILFLCEKETRGSGVTISILSPNGQNDTLTVCEIEIYGQS